MTTTDQESMDIDSNTRQNFMQEPIAVPRQLTEANELLNSINRRLEDCALEWQAKISRKQWKIFNSKAMGESPADNSILTRTYFTEKHFDEAFQHLLSCNKIFSEYLKNFIALLRGEQSILNTTETRDAQNQCTYHVENYKSLSSPGNEPLCHSSLANQRSSRSGKTQNLINKILSVQSSFSDVIKAKVNFDTKFLGFEATLHKSTSTPADGSCLCQYCSFIMNATNGEQKKLQSLNVNRRSRTARKRKRQSRSTRTLPTKKGKKPPVPITNIGDQPLVEANKS